MILSRLGNKKLMKDYLHKYFPKHKMRIELFFGSGGSYFYLPKPKYAILNDLDDDVTNLYKVLINQKEELIKQIELMPITSSLLNYWKHQLEFEPIKKAIRFLLISNFSYLGKGDTLRLSIGNEKRNLINNIEPTLLKLQNTKITNYDFREVIDKISFSNTVMSKSDAFVYLDPVYLDTEHTYKVPGWNYNDSEDCFKIMATSGIKCAMSEFNNPKILALAIKYKMNVFQLKERKNIKNRKIEILITNYEPYLTLF